MTILAKSSVLRPLVWDKLVIRATRSLMALLLRSSPRSEAFILIGVAAPILVPGLIKRKWAPEAIRAPALVAEAASGVIQMQVGTLASLTQPVLVLTAVRWAIEVHYLPVGVPLAAKPCILALLFSYLAAASAGPS